MLLGTSRSWRSGSDSTRQILGDSDTQAEISAWVLAVVFCSIALLHTQGSEQHYMVRPWVTSGPQAEAIGWGKVKLNKVSGSVTIIV